MDEQGTFPWPPCLGILDRKEDMAGKLIKRLEFDGGRTFEVVIYDLLWAPVDVIVNAANGGLSHGGGVAAAIADAAGHALDDECSQYVKSRGRLKVGEAVATTAGKLPFKAVIHAIGPRMGDGDEELKIAQALLSAFRIANENKWSSLAFPGISSGIFSVPYDVCARGYLKAVQTYFRQYPNGHLQKIMLCLHLGPLVKAVEGVLNA